MALPFDLTHARWGREGKRQRDVLLVTPAQGERFVGFASWGECLSSAGKHSNKTWPQKTTFGLKGACAAKLLPKEGAGLQSSHICFFYLIISVSLILFFSMTSCGICLHPKFIGQVKIPRWKVSTVM